MTAMAASKSDMPSGIPWWLVLIQGIASLIIGFFLITSPGITAVIVVNVLGWYWLITGILNIVLIFAGDGEVHWGWLLFQGILGIVAGFYILNHPLLSTVLVGTTFIIIMGVQGLIMGVLGVIAGFRGGGFGAVLLGGISIIFGIILLASPLLAATALPWVAGIFAIVGGIAAIVMAFRLRSA